MCVGMNRLQTFGGDEPASVPHVRGDEPST